MDIQQLLDNAAVAARQEELKTLPILSLGEAIAALESATLTYESEGEATDKRVYFDFGYMHPGHLLSWRGIYAELAISYTEDGEAPTAKDFLKELKAAVGKTYEGYKGGDFTMGRATPLHVDNYGHSNNTVVVAITVGDYDVKIRTWSVDD